jgi:hypothetical protein
MKIFLHFFILFSIVACTPPEYDFEAQLDFTNVPTHQRKHLIPEAAFQGAKAAMDSAKSDIKEK